MALKKTKKTKSKRSKNVSAIPAKEDFSVLDSAVSELARETEALLGKTGEKMSKPVLPKKRPKAKQKSKAKSFDIIHPKQAGRSEALLKAPHPGQKLIEADDGDNSAKAEAKDAADDKATPVDSVIEVSTHRPGSLKFTEGKTVQPVSSKHDKKDIETKDSDSADATEDTKLESKSELKLDEIDKTEEKTEDVKQETAESDKNDTEDETAKDSVKTSDDKEDGQPDDSEEDSSKIDDAKSEDAEVEGSKDPDSKKTDVSQKVQIYSDNLTEKQDNPDNEDDAEGPGIFDTDEYHPTLHDWSKLDHKSRLPIMLLLVLTIILAAGVYIVVSGTELPFINLSF